MRIAAFADRLKEALYDKGMTQTELSNATGISKSSISRWIKGDWEAKQDAVYAMAKALDVSEAWLMGYDVKPDRVENPKPTPYRIPVLGRVAAGIPIDAIQEVLDFEELPKHMENDGYEYFALQINGDSMTPLIMQGDYVIVRRLSTAKHGDIAIVLINGSDAACKRIELTGTELCLVSLNKNYPTLKFTPQEIDELPVLILGRVIEIRRKL